MTDTRDPQTEKGQNGATEENLAETAQAPEKTLEEQFREEICPTCTVKAEADETRLRALAEMENFKKRIQRDHDEYMRYASEPVLKDLLPALDSLDLAIQYGGSDETCKSLLTGVIMTRKLLLDALKNHGFDVAGEVGEPFNPDVHDAVSYEERDDMEPGLVSTLHQRGYRLKDRLLRPAKVSVSRKPGGTDDKRQGVRLARRRVTRRELGGRPARHFQRRVETGPAWAELFYGT